MDRVSDAEEIPPGKNSRPNPIARGVCVPALRLSRVWLHRLLTVDVGALERRYLISLRPSLVRVRPGHVVSAGRKILHASADFLSICFISGH